MAGGGKMAGGKIREESTTEVVVVVKNEREGGVEVEEKKEVVERRCGMPQSGQPHPACKARFAAMGIKGLCAECSSAFEVWIGLLANCPDMAIKRSALPGYGDKTLGDQTLGDQTRGDDAAPTYGKHSVRLSFKKKKAEVELVHLSGPTCGAEKLFNLNSTLDIKSRMQWSDFKNLHQGAKQVASGSALVCGLDAPREMVDFLRKKSFLKSSGEEGLLVVEKQQLFSQDHRLVVAIRSPDSSNEGSLFNSLRSLLAEDCGGETDCAGLVVLYRCGATDATGATAPSETADLASQMISDSKLFRAMISTELKAAGYKYFANKNEAWWESPANELPHTSGK